MREVRIALISWVDEEGFRRLHLLDHTPEQQAKVQQTLQTLQGEKQLAVFRFNSVVSPLCGNENEEVQGNEQGNTTKNSPYKAKKTESGWVITFSPSQRWQGVRVEQRYLYKPNTLEKLGIKYEEDPYAPANEYGTTNVAVVWERAVPDKILRKGYIIE